MPPSSSHSQRQSSRLFTEGASEERPQPHGLPQSEEKSLLDKSDHKDKEKEKEQIDKLETEQRNLNIDVQCDLQYLQCVRQMMVDLRFALSPVLEDSERVEDFVWTCENGICTQIQNIVKEFNMYRALMPVKIFISGPPAAGKSLFAKR
jgi:hypothetical protein